VNRHATQLRLNQTLHLKEEMNTKDKYEESGKIRNLNHVKKREMKH
jgi:hypothetical protein